MCINSSYSVLGHTELQLQPVDHVRQLAGVSRELCVRSSCILAVISLVFHALCILLQKSEEQRS